MPPRYRRRVAGVAQLGRPTTDQSMPAALRASIRDAARMLAVDGAGQAGGATRIWQRDRVYTTLHDPLRAPAL